MTGTCERFQAAHNPPAQYFHGFTSSDRIVDLKPGIQQCMSGVGALSLSMCREANHQGLFLGGSDSRRSKLAAYAE